MAVNMNDTVLSDSLLIRISGEIHGVTPAELSVYLEFSATQGNHAMITGLASLNPQSAYQSLLHKFVDKHGTERPGALKLLQIFRRNDLTLCAQMIEEEMRWLNMDIPDYVEATSSSTHASTESKRDTFLNDSFLLRIAGEIHDVTPAELSVYLEFSATQGDHAMITGLTTLNPQSAYESLLHRFVNKHGTDRLGALKLLQIFRQNDMTPCAEMIEKEMRRLNMDIPDYVEPTSSSAPASTETKSDTFLNDSFLLQIAGEIDDVSPSKLSVYLGFSSTQGGHAMITGLTTLNPQSAYESLLHRFVNKHGTDRPGALKLLQIFRQNDMTPCAQMIEKEMRRWNMDIPYHIEGTSSSTPALGNTTPASTETTSDTILNDSFLIRIAGEIHDVSPSKLGVHLGFSSRQGDHALITGLATLDPQSAYEILLHRFGKRHGTERQGALKLLQIFRQNDMTPCAEMIENEMRRLNMEIPDYIEATSSSTPASAEKEGDTILNDSFLLRIAREIHNVSPSTLSVYLGFSSTQGSHALITGLTSLYPQSAYESLLHSFVNKHGSERPGALKLLQIFRQNDMTPCARMIEKELERFDIDFPDHTEGTSLSTPGLPKTMTDTPALAETMSDTPALAETLNDAILSNSLLIRISGEIHGVTPAELSVCLEFSATHGDHAMITGLTGLNPQSAYQTLLHKYVNKHGTGRPGALKLLQIFRQNDMTPCAQMIEKELEKFNIPVPSDAETIVEPPVSLPSPSDTPGVTTNEITTMIITMMGMINY